MRAVQRLLILGAAAAASLASTWAEEESQEAALVYESCTTTAECVREADECVHPEDPDNGFVTTVGLCTLACATDPDCPNGGRCAALSDGRNVCVVNCDQGCAAGLVCWNGMCHPPWQ